ncbi:hypothetical protein [Pseudofulvimonas gallinarii]|jgi:hypothetical protein|uniref:Uncharacterized protein n=1 Tax=Pseudofulvimonas gallinarii TaxID=634155 RepID=A0A4R3LGP2_9GAMM|nr:hypothetical protein [Pseudofulvimonas gallinarii]TCS99323.1 hypothetical protein EDC25_106162 [Pseudofulvimonas gallinarii]
MRNILFALVVVATSAMPNTSQACDWTTGAREQHVFLSWDGKAVTDWVVASDSIKAVTLPNGFALGVKIEEPEPEKYVELSNKLQHVPETVKISLFDLSNGKPRPLTHTYGGTNSLQGYGAQGGADRVDELGTPGVLLTLLKPVCSQQGAVASAR